MFRPRDLAITFKGCRRELAPAIVDNATGAPDVAPSSRNGKPVWIRCGRATVIGPSVT